MKWSSQRERIDWFSNLLKWLRAKEHLDWADAEEMAAHGWRCDYTRDGNRRFR